MINPQQPDFTLTPAHPGRPEFHYAPDGASAAPLVSIVTPFYNTGPIFYETARSVLAQSLQQWEWLIVNDGSTDPAALAILDEFRAKNDPRIWVVDHETNRGLSAARNTGFAQARAPYVLLLDSDDMLEPTAAEKWFWFLETHPEQSFAGCYLVCFGALNYLWTGGFHDNEANLERNRITPLVMVRREVHRAVGGFDESMRAGLEDWEFWVRAASKGYLGTVVPEYLAWYRTRENHADRWANLSDEGQAAMAAALRERYPDLYAGPFPAKTRVPDLELALLPEDIPGENRLAKPAPRLLLLMPSFIVGGAEKFNLDLTTRLQRLGWEVTVVATAPSDHPWRYEYEALTPDVFSLDTFLEAADHPRFLRYLIGSRRPDAVLIASSREAYRYLPYLRAQFPDLPILDYLHFVTPDWMDGGIPRLSTLYQPFLDLTGVSSGHVKEWMVARGADGSRILGCHPGVDTHFWRPDLDCRARVREQLGLDEETALILYVGRLEAQKQPDVFAATMQRLAALELPFLALAVGDGSWRGWLEEFIAGHGLGEQVRLTGALPPAGVRELMAAGDVLFLPSANEGIATVFFEAMASGLVPVGADVGGQRELITPEVGFLLPRSTPEQEAEAYAEVLADLIRDPAKRAHLAAASRERIEHHFNLELLGERMLALIQAAAANRRKAGPPPVQALAHHSARAAVEYVRVFYEFQRVQERFAQVNRERIEVTERLQRTLDNPPMPKAPASTYFYFAFRALLLPLVPALRRVTGAPGRWLKTRIKRLLVRE